MDEILKAIYYDPEKGFTSSEKFYRRVRDVGVDVSRKDVDEWLRKQAVYQINYQGRKPLVYQSIYAPYIRYNYQMDILIQDKYKIDNYKYILCVVDTYSRYAQCRVMTNRENSTIVEKLKDIFEVMGRPERMNCDNEFNTRVIRDFLDGVRLYFSDPDEVNKNAIVERFNRTLLLLLTKLRTAGVKRWYKHVNTLVDNYNTRYHRTIDATPLEVWKGEKKSGQVLNVLDDEVFKVGDRVRLRIKRRIVDKATELYYSKEVYTIDSVVGKRYILRNDDGDLLRDRYKAYQLRKAVDIQEYHVEEEDVVVVRKPSVFAQRAMKELEGSVVLDGKRVRRGRDILDL